MHAIDINCACAGCVYAIDMARRYLATGDVKKGFGHLRGKALPDLQL